MTSFVICKCWDNALMFTHYMNEAIGWPLEKDSDYLVDKVLQFQWIEETKTGIVLFEVHEK